MARSYTSFGQRRALGRRYSIDPAYLLEADRLLNEYSLAPGREARALQESQFSRGLTFQAQEAALNRAQQAEDRQAQATAGMVGTGANLLTTAATIRALTKGAGEPFFGGLLGGGSSLTQSQITGGAQLGMNPAQTAAYREAVAKGIYSPTQGGTTYSGVNPATVDNALLSTGESAAGGGAAAAGAQAMTYNYVPQYSVATGETAAASGGGEAATAGVSAYGGPAAAGLFAGNLSTGVKEIGDIATLGKTFGGQKERDVLGGAGAGAAAGAAVGSVVPGVGTAIGAVVGAVTGAVGGYFGGGK